MSWIDLLLTVCALPVLGASFYLAALAVLARRRLPSPVGTPSIRFDIVVPAHNEEQEIGETIRSLLALDYPRSFFRLLIVADNCTDDTADVARRAGAHCVFERNDADRRGKGYALAHAFRRSLDEGFADAVVVVDADTLVSPNLLAAFAERLVRGALALQADYGVRNPTASWRTRLMTIALGAFHRVRSAARERCRLSCGLRGNGMAFSRMLLQTNPPAAFSIVEDLEYGLQLGYSGVRVEYVEEATVRGYMASSAPAAGTQRRRWERGRKALLRPHLPTLLRAAWHRRDPRLLDLALDLVVPPLGSLVLATGVGLLVSFAIVPGGAAPWGWGLALAGIVVYVMRGWAFSGVGPGGLLDLAWAPAYIMWKLLLRASDKGRQPREWERTAREARS